MATNRMVMLLIFGIAAGGLVPVVFGATASGDDATRVRCNVGEYPDVRDDDR